MIYILTEALSGFYSVSPLHIQICR